MPYSYSGVVKDIQYQIEKQKQRAAYTIPADNGSDEYEQKIKNMAETIASYKLNIQNDTEVIYKLAVHRNIFKVACEQFLKKVDNETKQLLLDTIKEVKDKRENDNEYKDYWWNFVNQEDFSAKLLWETKNPKEIDYTPYLFFPNIK